MDHGGVEAQFQEPVPFDFDDAEKCHVVDSAAGLNFGFIKIVPFYKRQLEANAVVPLTEAHPNDEPKAARIYAVIGCPSARKRIKQDIDFEPRTGHAQITVMHVRKLPKKDEPKALKYPRFFGKVLDEKVPDIEGFSGGPVLWFGPKKKGFIPYRVLGMQYAWARKTRVIRASPLEVLTKLFQEHLASKKRERRQTGPNK